MTGLRVQGAVRGEQGAPRIGLRDEDHVAKQAVDELRLLGERPQRVREGQLLGHVGDRHRRRADLEPSRDAGQKRHELASPCRVGTHETTTRLLVRRGELGRQRDGHGLELVDVRVEGLGREGNDDAVSTHDDGVILERETICLSAPREPPRDVKRRCTRTRRRTVALS